MMLFPSDSQKEKSEIDEERTILKEMLQVVEERDALVEVLDENRLKWLFLLIIFCL